MVVVSVVLLCLAGIDSQDIDVLVFAIEAALLVLFFRVDVELVLALDVLDVLGDFGEVWGQGGPFLLGFDAPDLDGAGFDAGAGEEGPGGVPFDDGGFFAVFQDAEERVGAEFPDIDVLFHVGGGDDVVGGGGAGGGGRGGGGGDGGVVPAQAVDEILEFVLDGEVDGGGVEVGGVLVRGVVVRGGGGPEEGEVGHIDDADDAIGAVGEELAAVGGQAEGGEEACADLGGVHDAEGGGFDDVDVAFGGAGDHVGSVGGEDGGRGGLFGGGAGVRVGEGGGGKAVLDGHRMAGVYEVGVVFEEGDDKELVVVRVEFRSVDGCFEFGCTKSLLSC